MNISSFFRIHPKKNEHDKEIDKKKEKRKSRRLDKHAGDTSNDAVSEKHVATSIHKADSTKAASSHPKNTVLDGTHANEDRPHDVPNSATSSSEFHSDEDVDPAANKANKKAIHSHEEEEKEERPKTLLPLPSPKPLIKVDSLAQLTQKETLGYGSFGCVHRVAIEATDQDFACKVLLKETVVKKKQVAHLKNERSILLACNSPFLIRMYASFADDLNIYLVLEYLDGGELFHLLRRSGRISLEAARFYAAEVVLALEYLHSYKIAFRDLKPENVLLNRKGHAKLCDFGFAKTVTDRTWTLCGTPEYLAPEVIMGIGHDSAVDWWAVGVLIFEMLAGYPPFYGEQPFEIYEKICDVSYRFPSSFDMITKDIISRFLTPQKHLRLGSSGAGVALIKKHGFFQPLDWGKIETLESDPPIVPPAPPQLPKTYFRERVENYDTYSIHRERDPSAHDPYADIFADFDMDLTHNR